MIRAYPHQKRSVRCPTFVSRARRASCRSAAVSDRRTGSVVIVTAQWHLMKFQPPPQCGQQITLGHFTWTCQSNIYTTATGRAKWTSFWATPFIYCAGRVNISDAAAGVYQTRIEKMGCILFRIICFIMKQEQGCICITTNYYWMVSISQSHQEEQQTSLQKPN